MKADTKGVQVTEQNKDLVTFVESIDFRDLYLHLTRLAGHHLEYQGFSFELKSDTYWGYYVEFSSGDVLKHTGLFAVALTSCGYHGFLKIFLDDGEWFCQGHIDIRYTQKSGGANGMSISFAQYSSAKGWVFVDG